jgi:sugar lactone lactonase YvrE
MALSLTRLKLERRGIKMGTKLPALESRVETLVLLEITNGLHLRANNTAFVAQTKSDFVHSYPCTPNSSVDCALTNEHYAGVKQSQIFKDLG